MKYKVLKGLISQKVDDRLTVFDGERSLLYTLNETASFIFKKVKSGKDKKDIVKELIKKYKIKRERAKRDVEELIENLEKKGIVKPTKK